MGRKCKAFKQLCTAIALLLVLGISSCKTSRTIPVAVAKPISTAKLLRKVEQNAFEYDYFSVKRMNCQFSSAGNSSSFKVGLKAIRNEAILISISKLNIPVGRVLLTPDSVKYVNYMDRNYLVDDYDYISALLNIDLNFDIIQSIISNSAFSYGGSALGNHFSNFDSYIESGNYVLETEKEAKTASLEKRNRTLRAKRSAEIPENRAAILQKMYFEPTAFALTKLLIIDRAEQRKMEMDFDAFENVGSKVYPGFISMNFLSEEQEVNLKVRMSGFSLEKLEPLHLSIPGKYVEVNVK